MSENKDKKYVYQKVTRTKTKRGCIGVSSGCHCWSSAIREDNFGSDDFPHHRYISLEDFDIRTIAQEDPRRFLADYPTAKGIILDEIQHAPHLLSYMQTIVDQEKKMGYFIITGSQNFLVDEAITQTLAGRMAVLTLLPLSFDELEKADLLPAKVETLIYKGSYPRAHAEKISIERLYTNYIGLYVKRDVRQIKNVSDLSTFQKFMRLCANHVSREVNLTQLGNDLNINHNTARHGVHC